MSEDEIARRYAFAKVYGTRMEDSPSVLNVTRFSDEAQFHLDGYINKKNVRFATSENPRLAIASPLHLERVTIWCALSSAGIFGPVFIDGKVTCDVYLCDGFISFLKGYGIPTNSALFQQDGARPHTTNAVLRFLCDVFEERVVSNKYPAPFEEGSSWTPISPDFKNLRLYSFWNLKPPCSQRLKLFL
jgi:hypothetical protein